MGVNACASGWTSKIRHKFSSWCRSQGRLSELASNVAVHRREVERLGKIIGDPGPLMKQEGYSVIALPRPYGVRRRRYIQPSRYRRP